VLDRESGMAPVQSSDDDVSYDAACIGNLSFTP
jgi:hypothetical protein